MTSHDVDDWFDEPESPDAWTARVDRIARDREARRPGEEPEDWLRDRPSSPAPGRRRARARPAALVVAALLVALLLGVLAAAGVFSGSAPRTTATSTTPVPRARSTPVTTTPAAQPPTLPTTPLKPGDHGTAVAQLQRALRAAGYPVGTIDGVYGPATTQAVTRFQQAHGLAADGLAGPRTLAALQQTG